MNRDMFSSDESNIAAEASSWIAQLETGKLTAADEVAFREWIGRSPRHAIELRYLANMSKELDRFSDIAYDAELAENLRRARVPEKRSRSILSFEAMVGGSVAAAVILAFVFVFGQINTQIDTTIYSTAVGEHREFKLPDGSTIELNTDSQIEVSYDRYNRKVRLLSGEAFFDVVPNADRPFWVYADDKNVRVVGTAFMVSLLDSNFELLVTEGRVELASSRSSTVSQVPSNTIDSLDQQSLESTALVAGQSISISDADYFSPVQTLSERDQRRELSWQEGLHDFSETSLEEVINQVTRYSQIRIEIIDPELRELKFGGVFRIGDTEPLFDALASAYGVQVRYLDDNSVTLSIL